MKRIRLGMVGGGEGSFIGGVHRIAARLDDQFELVAGALSSSPEVAKRSAEALFIAPERSYESWQQMVEAEAARPDGIEVVAIVTPNFLHVPIAKAFVEKKIHVICDKPLGISVCEGEILAEAIYASGSHFILTHNYSALPMVREARARIANSEIGDIRNVEVEYLQGWLNDRLELTDNKQASWRGKAAFAGAGAIGDIGTHAWQLAAFVTGMEPTSIRGELLTRIEGRELDDEVYAQMRYANGAIGRLWASQVAPGFENDLRLRIVGSRGSMSFRQQQPEILEIFPLHGNSYTVTRNGVNNHDAIRHQCRTPAGHPEGYLEGFAQIYREAAMKIRGEPAPLLPGIVEGLSGMRFIETLRASSDQGGIWLEW